MRKRNKPRKAHKETELFSGIISQCVYLHISAGLTPHPWSALSLHLGRPNSYAQEKASQILHYKHTYLNSIKIVNGQNCASLVFITEETESFGFPSFLISYKININNFPIPILLKRHKWFKLYKLSDWMINIQITKSIQKTLPEQNNIEKLKLKKLNQQKQH